MKAPAINSHSRTGGRLSRLAYEELKGVIALGKLKPGEILRESHLASRLEVSRDVVRRALNLLAEEGLVRKREAGGYHLTPQADNLLSGKEAETGPADLDNIGRPLRVIDSNSQAELHYDRIEREVASCLSFGRFKINISKLAENIDSSRTAAYQIMSGLERVNLVRREGNSRWYAGPLTPGDARDYLEIRLHFEPTAFARSVPLFSRSEILEMMSHLERIMAKRSPSKTEVWQVEQDLHVHLLQNCGNRIMLDMLYQSQLPFISRHRGFALPDKDSRNEAIHFTLNFHHEILETILGGNIEKATNILREHLTVGKEKLMQQMYSLGFDSNMDLPDYMIPA